MSFEGFTESFNEVLNVSAGEGMIIDNSCACTTFALVCCIRVSVDTLYRDGANDVSRERIQTAPLAYPGRAS